MAEKCLNESGIIARRKSSSLNIHSNPAIRHLKGSHKMMFYCCNAANALFKEFYKEIKEKISRGYTNNRPWAGFPYSRVPYCRVQVFF